MIFLIFESLVPGGWPGPTFKKAIGGVKITFVSRKCSPGEDIMAKKEAVRKAMFLKNLVFWAAKQWWQQFFQTQKW